MTKRHVIIYWMIIEMHEDTAENFSFSFVLRMRFPTAKNDTNLNENVLFQRNKSLDFININNLRSIAT